MSKLYLPFEAPDPGVMLDMVYEHIDNNWDPEYNMDDAVRDARMRAFLEAAVHSGFIKSTGVVRLPSGGTVYGSRVEAMD